MRVGDGRSDVEVDDGGRVVEDVEVGREVEEVGRDVEEELLVDVDELELSDVLLLELSELEELEDVEEEVSEVEEGLDDVLVLEVRVEVGSLVRVRVEELEVLEVIGGGASERCFVCFLYLTLPGGGSFFTGSPLSASVM